MVDAYFASPEFSAKSASTQALYLRYLREFQAELGEMHPDDLKPFHLARLRDNLAKTPGRANLTIKCIGAIYHWARELGWATQANPATGISMLELGEHPPWSQEALDAFPAALPPPLARACMVGLYTGQRLGDVLAMRRSQVEGGGVWVKQQKTGKLLLIPLHSAIREIVTQAPDIVCPAADGKPFSTDRFQGALTRAREKVPALSGVVFHGLRKNATVCLIEAGCTEAEVAAVTGMSLQMVVHYGKGARQRRLAVEALRKMELYPVQGDTPLSD
jgi:integrase